MLIFPLLVLFFSLSSVAKVELQVLGDTVISEKHTVAEPDSVKLSAVSMYGVCAHSCVQTKCATAACLKANITVCLFGSHTPVRSGYIKLSHTHTHVHRRTCPLQSHFPSVV